MFLSTFPTPQVPENPRSQEKGRRVNRTCVESPQPRKSPLEPPRPRRLDPILERHLPTNPSRKRSNKLPLGEYIPHPHTNRPARCARGTGNYGLVMYVPHPTPFTHVMIHK
jgi:hypothetical protein